MKIVITGWSKAEGECKNCTAYNKKKKREKKSEKKKNRKKNFKGKYKKEKKKR